MTESVLEYRIENGRTYHKYKDGSKWTANWNPGGIMIHWQYLKSTEYHLPNDERENDRLGEYLDQTSSG